MGYVLKAAFFY